MSKMSFGISMYFRIYRQLAKQYIINKSHVSKYVPSSCLYCSHRHIYTPESKSPPIPEYSEKRDESNVLKKARLLYQSRKRGMLENGLLLSTFASKYLNTMTEMQLKAYDKLINQPSNDWEIYYWITGAKPTPDEYKSDVMDMLKKHAQNENRETRIKQPDLEN